MHTFTNTDRCGLDPFFFMHSFVSSAACSLRSPAVCNSFISDSESVYKCMIIIVYTIHKLYHSAAHTCTYADNSYNTHNFL